MFPPVGLTTAEEEKHLVTGLCVCFYSNVLADVSSNTGGSKHLLSPPFLSNN